MIASTGRWRCALIGSEPLLVACAAALLERGHEIAVVVTRHAGNRAWAEAQGLPVHERVSDLLGDAVGQIDFLFSVTNLAILPPAVLAVPRHGAINFHDGPLPEMAGLNTPIWALLTGRRSHAVSWHVMDAEVDTGAVLVRQAFDIDADESAHSINTKCFAAGLESFGQLLDALPQVMETAQPGAPPLEYYGRERRPAAAATLAWQRGAQELSAFVRHLDFDGHANPLGMPKFRVGREIVLVRAATAMVSTHDRAALPPPGTITQADGEGLCIATGEGELRLTRLAAADGAPLSTAEAIMRYRLRSGMVLDSETDETFQALSVLDAAVAQHEPWWRRRLAAQNALILPIDAVAAGGVEARSSTLDVPLSFGVSCSTVAAGLVAYLARIADRDSFTLSFSDPVFAARNAGLEPWFATLLPLQASVNFDHGLAQLVDALEAERRQLHRHIGYPVDLIARSPELAGHAAGQVAVQIVDALDDAVPAHGAMLAVAIRADGGAMRWSHGEGIDAGAVAALRAGFAELAAAAVASPQRPIGTLPLMSAADRESLLAQGRGEESDVPIAACVHDLFVQQAEATPDAPAVTSRGVTLNYAQLDARSSQLAQYLRTLGVGPDRLVGLHLERSVEMLVALIAIHKAGGAYVPLDPAYPPDRIAHMVRDAGVTAIVTQDRIARTLPECDAAIVRIDGDRARIAAAPAVCPESGVTPANLAYVIYTSGSTGLPKGVMVEHRNVANFFAGMDRVIVPGGTLLAVTSLSFDISVLELCWTVARGCHVVIATREELTGAPVDDGHGVEFSLFYFASADGGAASDQYRLLLEGARFADTHGFAAVWTPERHFHAFGGLYPNPSVTSAAIAAVTTRVAIRGGSVVVPLHHPIRVAEEWSLVDNLSGGRVGIAFASGWQPNDFVLQPGNFADKSGALMRGIETVRALWRGETRSFSGPLGAVDVTIYPRPVQRELPFWITSAGNPETFAAAGRAGANVLTHLLGQTVAELNEKLAAYRKAWREAGHPGEGHATLMLHTFVGDDEAAVRAAVRQPLIDYLRTSTNLVKEFAWSFPAFKSRQGLETIDLGTLSDAEMSDLLDYAFDRYFETGGLFGTPERCLKMVDDVRRAGVNEIGCLIDFGIPAQTVLNHLPALDRLRQHCEAREVGPVDTLASLMAKHCVTHLQCTPSMAQMLASDQDSRRGLAALHQMMVGGEAFPPALAARLRALVGGTVHNMYGPTETTIWSSTHQVVEASGAIPLGKPLLNQQLHVVDRRGQLMPFDMPGELVIGGQGVVRGYHNRPELTRERFAPDPLGDGRAYRTGDLALRRRDGRLEYLGRGDHQVKVRGHRIELGEIEAVIGSYSAIARAIVTAREDVPGDVRLVAYFAADKGAAVDAQALREHLSARLPDFMVPAHLVSLEALPRLPNGKIDRSALPEPAAVAAGARPSSIVAPEGGTEQAIAAVWREVLNLPEVGTRDNFFDLGGHSLLAVQVHRRLRDVLGRQLPLTDVFRFPTIRALAAHIDALEGGASAPPPAPSRAAGRRAAMQRRLGLTTPAIRVDL